ncbi:ImmA/IrrE family metallo-endopeptidase [Citromicrobium sp. WPS32]|uniref:ImmA/IrrE family metallo-endopeptidase n=1 Tax=Citromicrobium sp. WPS32 TaxID=1634517 RepID=UPI0009EC8EE4|nr:ImmA/IrrE family metallo-endopeptidase [Citromicrobium sp. WPS32]|tara:strand:+ start:582 stop:1106 length:525 start_codon:yes stop_codon:yes gene_type:complete
MLVDIPSDDPAESLLLRAAPTDLEKFWDLMDQIPVPVGEIAARLGIDVYSVTLDPNISGLIKKNDSGIFEIQINNTDAAVRQRFTVCHEIGHFLLHRSHIDGHGIKDNILYRSKLSNAQEAEANRIAAALLLPWRSVKAWHLRRFAQPIDRANLRAIGEKYRASELAVGYRFGL